MLLAAIAVLIVLAVALAWLLTRVPAAVAVPHGRRREPRSPDRVGLELVAHGSASDVHRQLRPLLREIASTRLARQRISLDRDRDAARAALGPELWEIVRPGRPAPASSDRFTPGIELDVLRRITDRLETL